MGDCSGATDNAINEFGNNDLMAMKHCEAEGFTHVVWFINFPEEGTNCYAFAVNCPYPTGKGMVATPGAGSGNPVTLPVGEEPLIEACVADGLVLAPNSRDRENRPDPGEGHYLVCLYRIPPKGDDYHFIRQGPPPVNWSHKPDKMQMPSNTFGNEWSEFQEEPPQKIGRYEFVCYFVVPDEGIQVARHGT